MRPKVLLLLLVIFTSLAGRSFAIANSATTNNGEHNQCGSAQDRTVHDCGEHNGCGSSDTRGSHDCGDRKGCSVFDPDDCPYITPTITLVPNGHFFDQGQTIIFTMTVYNGIGPFNVELFNITGNSQQGSNVIIFSPGGSNTISFVAGAVGVFSFNAIATDMGVTPPFVFNSLPDPISYTT